MSPGRGGIILNSKLLSSAHCSCSWQVIFLCIPIFVSFWRSLGIYAMLIITFVDVSFSLSLYLDQCKPSRIDKSAVSHSIS
jgi:hypothetical protein